MSSSLSPLLLRVLPLYALHPSINRRLATHKATHSSFSPRLTVFIFLTLYREQSQWASSESYTEPTLKDYDYSAPSWRQIEEISTSPINKVRRMIEKRFDVPSKVGNLILNMAEYCGSRIHLWCAMTKRFTQMATLMMNVRGLTWIESGFQFGMFKGLYLPQNSV